MKQRCYSLISFFFFSLLLLLSSCRVPEEVMVMEYEPKDREERQVLETAYEILHHIYKTEEPVRLFSGVHVQNIEIDEARNHIKIFFNNRFALSPLRPDVNDEIYHMFREKLPGPFKDYQLVLFSENEPIDELIPNYYRRSSDDYDYSRMPYTDTYRPLPVVKRHGRHVVPELGLEGSQIALWHSHGWYYDIQKKRWEWQRPRLFQTAEDLLPMAFTLPYIIPMLENAGAYVWVPRERDTQANEVIVDFEKSTGNSIIRYGRKASDLPEEKKEGHSETDKKMEPKAEKWKKARPGFAIGNPPYGDGVNPFRNGFYRYRTSSEENNKTIQWIPDIPESGKYAVYISYTSLENSAQDAQYSVYHRGGRTDFSVNQSIGGGTWVYLGHFDFKGGIHPDKGRVELSDYSQWPSVITADAIRFGGGIGNIEREGTTSGRPRYLEAARYYMQFAGMPDSLVYGLSNGRSDNVDDFRGRGEWVNYLKGAPYGPNKKRETPGLGIPVDLSLSFHTDAGITRNDTVVGTLMIYSIEDGDSIRVFPDNLSRLANRDFADIMQTQIVEDIQNEWDSAWNRRMLMNRMYSEAFRPNVPAVLLELLSHQNFLDMQFALDPRFRFDVSRSIYKSMLRFLANQYGKDYVIQPLPVSNFRAITYGPNEILLRWDPVPDTIEPDAMPDRYIVYIRKGDKPFGNGTLTTDPELLLHELKPGILYQFKIVAANKGGKSFPSETLAVFLTEEPRRPVLIVNGFERISGPAIVDEEGFKGFAHFQDRGVPDRQDILFTGDQFDFDPESAWRTNDDPGHGASYANYETKIIPGNTFDWPALYGESLMEMGVPFVSASVASIRDHQVNMSDYDAVLLVLGLQKNTPYPKDHITGREPAFQAYPLRLRQEITRYLQLGGRLFITGAHTGTDPLLMSESDPDGLTFIRKVLGYTNETNHAARTGKVRVVNDKLLPQTTRFSFNTTYHPDIYRVDAPDAIEPYADPVPPGISSRDDGESAGVTPSSGKKSVKKTDNSPDAGEYVNLPDYGHKEKRMHYLQMLPSQRKEITPSGPETLIRYEENQFSAGVGFRSDDYAVITFGFPFETIIDSKERYQLLKGVLEYLGIVTAP